MNITTRATGAMLIGTGNTVTNSLFKLDDAMGNKLFGATYGSLYYIENKDTRAAGNNLEIYYDDVRSYINDYMAEGSGAVSIVGNSNKADYAIRSQIIGNANAVTGTEEAISSLNMVSGFGNKAESISRSSIIGTGNELKGGENNVIIGDYHKLKDGKRNVILGSMKTEEKEVEKTEKNAIPWKGGKEIKYTVKENVPLKSNTDNIEEAVMLGYNTDVSQTGGVALGANSIASTASGIAGYDPVSKKASEETGSTWKSTWAAVSVGDGANTRQITGVAAGFADTDAVNVAQLKSVMTIPVKIYSGGSKANGIYTAGGTTYKMNLSNLQFDFGDGIKAEEVETNGDKKIFVSLDKDYISKDDTLRGPKGENGKDGKSAYDIWKNSDTKNADKTEKEFLESLKGKDGKDGKDGGVGTVKSGTNITVENLKKDTNQAPQYKVSLNDEITLKKVTTGNATQSANGFIVKNGPSMTVTGIDAGGKKITNVADGTAKSDAVNYGQLQVVEETANRNTEAIRGIGGQMNRLSNRINDVGASAAALAALHPLEYDPTDKWNFAVGYGNYKNANSVALGAFYRASNNFMVSVGGSFGNDEKMVNAGLSFRFGQGGNELSRPVMAKKMASLEDTVHEQIEMINRLKATVEEQNKKMAALEELIKQQGELLTKVAK